MTYPPPGGPGQQPWPGQQSWPGQPGQPPGQQSWPSPMPGEQSWPAQVPGPMPGQQPWQNQMPGGPQTAGSAVASLVLGLLAMLALCGGAALSTVGLGMALALLVGGVFTLILGIAAVVTGIGARRKIRMGAATGSGLAITGLVLGLLALVVMATLVALVVGAIILEG